jgi:hypothetical protein
MSFWTDSARLNEFTDPKRKYSWWLQIGPGEVPHWALKKSNKPQMTIAEPEHKYLNHTFYFPGSVKWNSLDLTMVDPGSPDVSQALAKIIQKSGYVLPGISDAPTTISKRKAVQALGSVKLVQYDADSKPIETWTLQNAWIADINWGEVTYDDEGNLVEISVKLRYDWATFEGRGGSKQFGIG